MPDAQVVTWISQNYTAIEADLDERARRRWAAAEARSWGWGGTAAVAKATGGIGNPYPISAITPIEFMRCWVKRNWLIDAGQD